MKKTAIAALILALSSCSLAPPDQAPNPEGGPSTTAPATHVPKTYSNLADEASLAEVRQALLDAGLPQKDVDAFTEQVKAFNGAVPHSALVSGYQELDQAAPDDGSISQAITDSGVRLTNCRITTFTLAQSLITASSPHDPNTEMLFMDHEQIDVAPKLFTSNQDVFDALNGWIETTSDKATDQRTADIESYLSDQGIAFAESDASVIDVYVHDTLDSPAHSFIGHTGVLLETGHELLFIEKLAFDAPYRAIWFSDRGQLAHYLMSMYDDGPDVEYGSPIIFENGAPLQS